MTQLKTAALIVVSVLAVVAAGVGFALFAPFCIIWHVPKIWRAALDPRFGIEIEFTMRLWPIDWPNIYGAFKIHQTMRSP